MRGAGAEQTTLKGQGTARVLMIAGGFAVTVQDLTVSGGAGGIVNAGDLTLREAVVTDNDAGETAGGGIFNVGMLTLQHGRRITGNTATAQGGGIFNNGTVILQDGSVVGGEDPVDANTADTGGGIRNHGTLTLQNGSKVVGNTAGTGGGILNNVDGEVTVQDDAFVCDNQPSDDQCGGLGTYTGTCPNPGETCPG